MTHDLFGDRMAYVGEVPWHGLGKEVPETVTSIEMCKAAGLDWTVRKVPAPGSRIVDVRNERYDRYLIFRQKLHGEMGEAALGMVGSGYEPVQNSEAFEFFEPFISSNFARFHTAGALGNGERVWVLARLNEQISIGRDDLIDRYLLLSNTHNGSGSVSVRFTPIRVVCQNTLSFAMKRSSGVISIRHTRHVARHLLKAQAEQLKRIVEKTFADATTLFGNMAMRSMSYPQTDEFLEQLFPRSQEQKDKRRQPERWQRIKAILDDERVTPAATRRTLWGLYNAVIRDEDFRATREVASENRLDRVWFGAGHDLKIKTLNLSRKFLQKAA